MANNLHLDGDFTLNIPEYNADFQVNSQPEINADFNIKITPEKVSQLENDLNFQTQEQVQEAIQAESTVINGRIDEEVARLEDEIEQSVTTIVGSDLIGVETQNQTVTITSKTFVYEQGIASATWVINHNLNKEPSWNFIDSAGNVQLPSEVIYNDTNTITAKFLAGFAGKAFLN